MAKGAFIKSGGSLKNVNHIFTKVNGSPKEIKKGWVRVGGELKLFFTKDEYTYKILKHISVEAGHQESEYTGSVKSYVAEWQEDGSLLMAVNINEPPTYEFEEVRPCVHIHIMKSDGTRFTGNEIISISTYSQNISPSYNHIAAFSVKRNPTLYILGSFIDDGYDEVTFHPDPGAELIEIQLIVGSSSTYYASCRIDLLKINDTTLIPGMFP